jgi:hypothetical protein
MMDEKENHEGVPLSAAAVAIYETDEEATLDLTNLTFLCEVQPDLFFTGFLKEGSMKPGLTEFPCRARHMTYRQADTMCNFFLRRNYTHACVTDVIGEPISTQMLRASTTVIE